MNATIHVCHRHAHTGTNPCPHCRCPHRSDGQHQWWGDDDGDLAGTYWKCDDCGAVAR